MPLRIACDLDGTVADMDAALQHHAEVIFGGGVQLLGGGSSLERAMNPDGVDTGEVVLKRGNGLSVRQMRELWTYVSRIENFWQSLNEVEVGSTARFAQLATRHRWEVLFLTQRPETAGDTAQVQSQRWLRKHGFDMPSVFVINGSRGKVAAALNLHAVLDDRADNCLDVATESKARPMLVWRGTPDSVPPGARALGIAPFFTFSDALDQLDHMTLRAMKPRGLLLRAQKALGI
jgi:hypothetical protein